MEEKTTKKDATGDCFRCPPMDRLGWGQYGMALCREVGFEAGGEGQGWLFAKTTHREDTGTEGRHPFEKSVYPDGRAM